MTTTNTTAHHEVRSATIRVIANALRDAPTAKASDHLQVRLVEMTCGQLVAIRDFSWNLLSRGDKKVVREAACEAALHLKLCAYEAKSANQAWGLLSRAWELDQLACRVIDPKHTPSTDRADWVEAELADA